MTKRTSSLFPLKDKNQHPSCKIYSFIWFQVITRAAKYTLAKQKEINEHEKWNGESEPSKHLIRFPTHTFKWSILSTASITTRTRKNLEASFIALFKLSLNCDQVLSNELNFFKNGVTCCDMSYFISFILYILFNCTFYTLFNCFTAILFPRWTVFIHFFIFIIIHFYYRKL